MDIQHLVDRLEDLIDEGRHMPFSRFTMVDEERALELIDQMRISIPEEIEKAARVLAQRDRILAQANEEAARIVQQARERSEQLVDRESMVQQAQNRASTVVDQAQQEAAAIMADADQYVLTTLNTLEQQLGRAMREVRNGIQLQSEQMAPPPQAIPVAAPAPRQLVEAGPRPDDRKK
jgi:hypothetical protein